MSMYHKDLCSCRTRDESYNMYDDAGRGESTYSMYQGHRHDQNCTPQTFLTAYAIAVKHGFKGSEEAWLASLQGKTGMSAYEAAVEAGYTGTAEEFAAEQAYFAEHAAEAARAAESAAASAEEARGYLAEMENQHGSWETLMNKPFERIGENLKVISGELMVDTANAVERDNTRPITAAAVHMEVGNIAALLNTI